jgi:hypothetical protein
MRRLLLVLTVALVMAAMMAATAMPAFAAQPRFTCSDPNGNVTGTDFSPKDGHTAPRFGYTCTKN